MAANDGARPTMAIVATAVWGLLLVPGLLAAALSPMFFDAPGSMINPAAWTNALIVVSFPVLCLVSIAGSWIVWRLGKRSVTRAWKSAGLTIVLLPALPIGYFAALMALGTIGVLTSGQPLGLHSTIIKH